MRRYLGALAFGVIGIGILISLAVWQLQRLDWKRGILANIEARIAAAPVPIPADPDPEGDRYLAVTATGHIGPGELHLLDSIQNVGPVWRIIVPFVTDGRTVLLDRGYVLDGRQNDPHAGAVTRIVGNLIWPDDRTSSTPPNDPEKNIWFARDLDEMARALGTEPLLVVAREDTGDGITPLPVSTEGIPNDHLQYAITWFLLAGVWAGMTGLLLWRISRRTA
ncbi:SURF1 family protein [Frigidibacter sp. ROC022]|uniref:SURF1 family protein n=1 Tax=Frigidibacter sp. ROC022 TaxID=2971796 RepID=UPI00215A6D66|nr:SURF1 family protein [Frigidibacter sp. ROC022]MCR8723983.1 SURF1 family protein [Frigidibacter sp. ROC022]